MMSTGLREYEGRWRRDGSSRFGGYIIQSGLEFNSP